jgi:hypothetical protein
MQVDTKLSRHRLSLLEPFLECLGPWDRSLRMILNEVTDRSKALEVPTTSVAPVEITFETFFPENLVLDLANSRRPRTNQRLQSFCFQKVALAPVADNPTKRTCRCERDSQLNPLCMMNFSKNVTNVESCLACLENLSFLVIVQTCVFNTDNLFVCKLRFQVLRKKLAPCTRRTWLEPKLLIGESAQPSKQTFRWSNRQGTHESLSSDRTGNDQ